METSVNTMDTSNFSSDLQRALLIAPPPPADLEIIETGKSARISNTMPVSPKSNIFAENLSNKKIFIFAVGILIAGCLFGYFISKNFKKQNQREITEKTHSSEVANAQPANIENT